MPTRSDVELATPLCTRRVVERDGQHGVHFTCFKLMHYDAPGNAWTCSCGNRDAAELIIARRWEAVA